MRQLLPGHGPRLICGALRRVGPDRPAAQRRIEAHRSHDIAENLVRVAEPPKAAPRRKFPRSSRTRHEPAAAV